MKEQVPFLLSQGLYKHYQPMGQSASVVQDNSTDDSSELFLIPLILQGVQQTSNIHQFTGDMTGKRQNFTPHINTQPHTVF